MCGYLDQRKDIYVQYWQSDSDGQIYFPMVQMDPSDKQVPRRRTFFRWKINDVMTHGKQMLVNSDCPMDPMDPSDKRVYYRTNNYPMDI